jgi:predicted DNA-binding transcriptional regulator YafY
MGDNPGMDLTQEQIEKLEAALARLEELDPAELPEPAAELANLLGSILEDSEPS